MSPARKSDGASKRARLTMQLCVSGDAPTFTLSPRSGERLSGRLLAFLFAWLNLRVMAIIHVLGAGITGIWQALILQSEGHQVTLVDLAGVPSSAAASRLAGAMLAPFCEGETGHELVRELGVESLELWQKFYPEVQMKGTLVVATPRDHGELERFASITAGHRTLNGDSITDIEPSLGNRFSKGLFFTGEGHVEPVGALASLLKSAQDLGLVTTDEPITDQHQKPDWIVDCRGLAARDSLKTLRGVRGERIVIESSDVKLQRPVRLLHPRIPFYIVPWAEHRFMIGASVIESDDGHAPTLRTVAELLGAAYTLNPAFGDARVIKISAGVRPAFPDNMPKIIVRERILFVNGLYRHGFLLSPILARTTAAYIKGGKSRKGVVFEDHGEW